MYGFFSCPKTHFFGTGLGADFGTVGAICRKQSCTPL
jgi:hypothetical protein